MACGAEVWDAKRHDRLCVGRLLKGTRVCATYGAPKHYNAAMGTVIKDQRRGSKWVYLTIDGSTSEWRVERRFCEVRPGGK